MNGWDIFETHYFQPDQECPALTNISASEFQVENADGSTNLVTPSQAYANPVGDCFAAGTEPYVPVVNSVNSYWTVSGGG